jgi:hypothetical protein
MNLMTPGLGRLDQATGRIQFPVTGKNSDFHDQFLLSLFIRFRYHLTRERRIYAATTGFHHGMAGQQAVVRQTNTLYPLVKGKSPVVF